MNGGGGMYQFGYFIELVIPEDCMHTHLVHLYIFVLFILWVLIDGALIKFVLTFMGLKTIVSR